MPPVLFGTRARLSGSPIPPNVDKGPRQT